MTLGKIGATDCCPKQQQFGCMPSQIISRLIQLRAARLPPSLNADTMFLICRATRRAAPKMRTRATVCVCVCVLTDAPLYIHIYVCMYTVYVYTYVYTYIHTYIHVCVCVSECVSVSASTCICYLRYVYISCTLNSEP